MQGMYDFWANPRVKAEAILTGHRVSTIARISTETVVLAIQDTSELDYSDHRRSTSGLGSLSNPEARGLKLHTVLAVSDTGVPLGILHQQMWSRERYSLRWLIERYFYSLQTGYRIEQLQLESGDRLEWAVATYSIVAWRLLWLMYEARRNPERSVEGILEPVEWRSLYLLTQQTQALPSEVPTLGACIRWIAKLGGFLGRKGDGEPGIQTIWRGWMRLMDAIAIWKLVEQRDR